MNERPKKTIRDHQPRKTRDDSPGGGAPISPELMICLAVVVLFFASLAAYTPSFRGEYVGDDKAMLLNQRESLSQLFPSDPNLAGVLGKKRIVGRFTFALNYRFGEFQLLGYHLVNYSIHLLAGLCLFGLVRRTLLLPQFAARFGQASTGLAFAAAGLWLLHPMSTQAVTYVVQRLESLMGLFFLLSLYCVLRGASSRASAVWYVLAAVAVWLGMGTKEVMVTAPLVILLYDRVFLEGTWAEWAKKRGWMYAVFAAAMIWVFMGMWQWFSVETQGPAGFGGGQSSQYSYPYQEAGVIVRYLRLAFWPEDLCFDYRGWPWPRTLGQAAPYGLVILALLAGSIFALCLRRWRGVGFLGLSFFLVLAPTSSFYPIVDAANEYRMYLPLASLAVLVTLVVHWAAERFLEEPAARRFLFIGLVTIGMLGLGFRTLKRNLDYTNSILLFESCAKVNPRWRPFVFLGESCLQRAEQLLFHNPKASEELAQRAIESFTKARDEGTDKPELLSKIEMYLGDGYKLQELLNGQVPLDPELQAETHFQRSLALDDKNLIAHLAYGEYLLEKKRYEAALEHLRASIPPGTSGAHFVRLQILTARFGRGESQDAIAGVRELVADNPTWLAPKLHLARMLATAPDEKLRAAPEAVQIADDLRNKPGGDKNAAVLDVAAEAYAAAGKFDEAISTGQRAAELAAKSRDPQTKEIESRLELYRNQKAYIHQPPAVPKP